MAMTGLGDLQSSVRALLAQLEQGAELQPVLQQVLNLISEASGCESVGIRWKAGEDYPYCVTRGFGRDFELREGPLCERDAVGTILRHPNGLPQLACMCGAVVSGKTDPKWPFFTEGGSFWSNQVQSLKSKLDPGKLGFRVRAYCAEVGYELVALIPLKAQNEILGVLQMNSRQPVTLNQAMIETYEQLASDIARAVAPRMVATNAR